MNECTVYEKEMNNTLQALQRSVRQCESNLEKQCDSQRDAACYGRIQGFPRRAAECGDAPYSSSEQCKAPAHEAACLEYRLTTNLSRCLATVQEHQQRAAKEQAAYQQAQARQEAISEAARSMPPVNPPTPTRTPPPSRGDLASAPAPPTPSSLPPPNNGSLERERPVADETFEEAKDILEEGADDALKKLEDNLKEAKRKLSPADFKRYENQVQDARDFLKGFTSTLKGLTYGRDLSKCVNDAQNDCGDIVKDGLQDGFDYVLERVAPNVAKIVNGPVGLFVSITLSSTSTQTPAQDFDPMNVLNNPQQYSFQQRVDALRLLYESEQRHPEAWNDSKRKWLFGVTQYLYNSPDNPNIHLTPTENNPAINITPR